MRGVILLAVACLVLLSVSTEQTLANTVTLGVNESYVVGGEKLLVEPYSTDGIRYIIVKTQQVRLWKVKDCQDFGVTRSCLSSSTNTTATFQETYIGGKLTAQHALAPTSISQGEESQGTVTLTKSNPLRVTDVELWLEVIGNASFRDGSKLFYHYLRQVDSSASINYRLNGDTNGSAIISGKVTYFDQNSTQTITLQNRTLTTTIPFTLSVSYDNSVFANNAPLKIRLNKRISENLSVDIIATFPNETVLFDAQRGARIQRNIVNIRDDLDDESLATLNATYNLTDFPTAPLTVTVHYWVDGGSRRTFQTSYDFSGEEYVEPSLGVKVSPVVAGSEGIVSVLVTGNQTGTLVLESDLINTAKTAPSGTHDFAVNPNEEGNYTINITYFWTTPYGARDNLSGRVTVEVTRKTQPPEPETVETEIEEPEPTIVIIDDEKVQDERENLLLWIVSGAAAGCLVALAWLLHRLKDPLRKVEALLRKASELRKIRKRHGGVLTQAEEDQLAELERELSELQRKL